MPAAAHKPTRKTRALVAAYKTAGAKDSTIAALLNIGSVNTLKKHYKTELEHGKEIANAGVAGVVYQSALMGVDDHNHLKSAFFWLKTRAGWRETATLEVTDKRYMAADEPVAVDPADWLAEHAPDGKPTNGGGNGTSH